MSTIHDAAKIQAFILIDPINMKPHFVHQHNKHTSHPCAYQPQPAKVVCVVLLMFPVSAIHQTSCWGVDDSLCLLLLKLHQYLDCARREPSQFASRRPCLTPLSVPTCVLGPGHPCCHWDSLMYWQYLLLIYMTNSNVN